MNSDLTKDKLFQVLLEEIHAYYYLAETVQQKQKAIKENNLEELEKLTGIERLLVSKLELLLHNRRTFISNLSKHENSTLTDFISELPVEERQRWLNLRDRIKKSARMIAKVNAENEQMIRSSLNYVRGMVAMLFPQDEGEQELYQKDRKNKKMVATRHLVNCNV